MKLLPNNFFLIKETFETPTGQMHHIAWKCQLTRRFLKNISKEATDLGWMRSGDYSIKHTERGTTVMVSERVVNEFVQLLDYLTKRYED